jgi:hypothetical protein
MGTAIVEVASPSLTSFFDEMTAFVTQDETRKLEVQLRRITALQESSHGFGFLFTKTDGDKELLQLQMKLDTLKLIGQTSIDIKNQGINGLLGSLAKPPGYTPDIEEIKVNPNLKLREDSLKKFYDDMDAITQTGGEKLFADTSLLQARLDVLVKDGIISQADAFNRARSPADTKALADFFSINKTIVDQSVKDTTDDIKAGFAAQADAARRAGEAQRAEFERTRQFADATSGAITNLFAGAFENIGKGGLGGLVANFVKAFQQIVAQAEAVNLAKALGLGTSSEGGSWILGALGSLFTGYSGSAGITNGAGSQDVPRFAGGGSFTVGGTGGTDSQLVQFRASPNERVSVTTPGQGSGVIINQTVNIDSRTDSSQIYALVQQSTQRAVQQSKAEITQLIKRGAFV